MANRTSISQVSMYLRCPHQWYLRYVKNLKMPPAGAPLQGIVYHGTLAGNFMHKLETGNDLDVPTVADLYGTLWESQVMKNKDFSPSEILWNKDEPIGKAKDAGYLLVNEYHTKMASNVNPEKVELKLVKPVTPELEVVGVIDLITTEGVLVDHKVSSKKKSESEADKDIQAAMYCWMTGLSKFEFHQAIKGKLPKKFLVDKQSPPINPSLNIVKTSRSEKQLQRFIAMIIEVNKLMNTGIFPARGDSYLCSKNYCGYWNVCKARYNVY